jgi:hypothetical protein
MVRQTNQATNPESLMPPGNSATAKPSPRIKNARFGFRSESVFMVNLGPRAGPAR